MQKEQNKNNRHNTTHKVRHNSGEKNLHVHESIQKFPDWLPGARTANGTTLCH
jgi:hypothetical protein